MLLFLLAACSTSSTACEEVRVDGPFEARTCEQVDDHVALTLRVRDIDTLTVTPGRLPVQLTIEAWRLESIRFDDVEVQASTFSCTWGQLGECWRVTRRIEAPTKVAWIDAWRR